MTVKTLGIWWIVIWMELGDVYIKGCIILATYVSKHSIIAKLVSTNLTKHNTD